MMMRLMCLIFAALWLTGCASSAKVPLKVQASLRIASILFIYTVSAGQKIVAKGSLQMTFLAALQTPIILKLQTV